MISVHDAISYANDPILIPGEGMRRVLEAVWQEAYGTGSDDAYVSMGYDGGATPAARINPYRKEQK